ncbi:MAG: MYG1 family protein [Candidatus Lokiarchaeota archaeon]|nr:MYG1 family protein [Candidatus Lokiarchaeota archaeon]
MHKIVTHPGSAHLDDLLSTCLVLSRDPAVSLIERRNPSEEELKDPDTWVLDIGKALKPKLRNFDHHQEAMDDCTLSLLLRSWNLFEEASNVFSWLPIAVLMDSRGPSFVQERLGIDKNAVDGLESFVEEVLLDLFQENDRIVKGEPLFILLKTIGERFFSQLKEYRTVQAEIQKKASFTTIKGVPVITCLGVKPNAVFFKVLERTKRDKWGNGGACVYDNDRPEKSMVLKRYDDDSRIDFTRLAGKDKILFAHKNGFMVATAPLSEQEIEKYLALAID